MPSYPVTLVTPGAQGISAVFCPVTLAVTLLSPSSSRTLSASSRTPVLGSVLGLAPKSDNSGHFCRFQLLMSRIFEDMPPKTRKTVLG